MPLNQPFLYHCPIKINLALHVLERLDNGYHALNSLVIFKKTGDRLTVQKSAKQNYFQIKSEKNTNFPEDFIKDNLVIKAANLLRAQVKQPLPAVSLLLEKNLPLCSGIGAGSGNAATALYGLNKIWQLNFSLDTLLSLAKQIGADVPACLHYLYYKKALYMEGIGEKLTIIENFPNCAVLIANPLDKVDTKHVFQNLSQKKRSPLKKKSQFKTLTELIVYLKTTRNDLYQPAVEIAPNIAKLLQALTSTKPLFTQMSGSGATCFAIYKNMLSAKNAMENLTKQYPTWFFQPLNITTK